jgi:predicted MFS family arabinose efflux permease
VAEASEVPVGARIAGPIVLGAVLLAAFVRHALRAPDPIVDLHLFADRGFSASSALLFLSGLGLFGSMFLLPLYYLQVHGTSVVMAGLLLAPQGIGGLLARGLGGVSDRIGPRPVVLLGIALTVAGTVPFAFAGSGEPLLAAALVVRGIGMSATNMAVMVGAFGGLTGAQIPHASTLTRIAQQLGGSVGTAVLAVVLQAGSGAGPAAAFDGAFRWAVALSALAVVPALLLPRRRTST